MLSLFNVIRNFIKNYFSFIILVISMIFYFFFAFYDGAVICPDSNTYINMIIYREPFYPVVLAIFRALFTNFGTDFYLTVVVYVQSILAAISSWSMIMYLRKKFLLNELYSVCFLCMILLPSLVWRVVEQWGCTYSNSILTEGITILCYILFIRFLLEYVDCERRKCLYICCLLVFVLISTRKQMINTLILLIVCILLVHLKKKECRKGIMIADCCLIMILLGNIVLDIGYNYIVRGVAVRHSGDTRFISTMIVYTADREDSKSIEDEEIKKIFLEIYDICDENDYLKKSSDNEWSERISHFIKSYDNIQLYIMRPIINEFVQTKYDYKEVDLNKKADFIMNSINRSLIFHNSHKIMRTIMDNFLLRLVMTVSHWRYFTLRVYSLFIYISYILLLLYHAKRDENRKIFLFAALTLCSVLINVALVSMVIFCQIRYMIYNTALFYISLILMAKPIIIKILKKFRKEC